MNLNKLLTALRQRKNTPARNQQSGRRERYTHALEQFLDGHHPAVRLGGVYTLANLADEWLADDSLPEQVRREEAQAIIDALTGCIRTPYPLAQKRQILESDEAPEGYEGDFTRDQEALREEQLVRRTVFVEFSRRLAVIAESSKAGNEESQRTVPPISPMWADLRFDFSGAPIFYPLQQLHFQNADFASATFYGPADFSAQPSTVTPASPRHSSPLTRPSRARISTTGWGSAPHTSRAQQSSAGHALRTRQASQP